MRVPVGTQEVSQDGIAAVNQSRGSHGNNTAFSGAGLQVANAVGKVADFAEIQLANEYHDQLNKANKTRVLDANTKLEKYDQDQSVLWSQQLGEQVIMQPNSRTLEQNVMGDRDDFKESILEGLGNDDQKEMFLDNYARSGISLRGRVINHEAAQYRNYQQSTLQGAIESEVSLISKNYNDPQGLKSSIDKIKVYGADLGELNGIGRGLGEQETDKFISTAIRGSIDSAMQQGDHGAAMDLLGEFQGSLSGRDTINIKSSIAENGAAEMANSNPAKLEDLTNKDRLENAIITQESGGRDFDNDGNPIASTDGHSSLYSYQVTLATAKNPGFGINPAQNNTAEEYNRVGKQLIAVYKDRYDNDPEKIAGAYNAGAGAVDKAIQIGGDNWLQHMPKSTREVYIPNVMDNMKGGTFVDMMTPKQKSMWNSRAKSQMSKGRSINASNLKASIGNQYSQTAQTGETGDRLTPGHFQVAYAEGWHEKYQEYTDNIDHAEAIFSIKDMPRSDANDLIRSSMPVEGQENYKTELKQYSSLVKAYKDIDDQRRADPVEYAIHANYGLSSIDFSSPNNAAEEIKKRSIAGQEMYEKFGTNYEVLSNREKTQYSQILNDGTSDEKIEALKMFSENLSNPDLYNHTVQQLKLDSPATAIAGQLIGMDRTHTTSSFFSSDKNQLRLGEDVARTILRGESIINPSKTQKGTNGVGVSVKMPSTLNEQFYDQIGNSMAGDPQAEQSTLSAVRAYYAAKMDKSDTGLDSDILTEAIENITGGISTHASVNVIPPFGMGSDDFINQSKQLFVDAMGNDSGFDDMPIIPAGNNMYYMQNGPTILTKDGEPVVLDFSQ